VRKNRKYLKITVKVLLTIVIFVVIFSKIDPKLIVNHFLQMDMIMFLIAFLLFNLSKILSAIRLNSYFKVLQITLSQLQNLILYYIGMFYNLFLPGGIGGDGYKIYLLQKHYRKPVKTLIAATLIDRISGLVALLFLSGVLFFLTNYAQHSLQFNQFVFICTLILIPLFYLFSRIVYLKFQPIFFTTLLMGFAVQIVQLLSAYFLMLSLGIEDFIFEFLLLFLLSSIAAVLPITIGGVGTRELVFIYGLSLLSFDVTVGIAFAMLFFVITAISSFLGIFLSNPLLRH